MTSNIGRVAWERRMLWALAMGMSVLPGTGRAESPPSFVLQWGSYGSGPGQFLDARGIGLGPDGSVYVADLDANRVQRFSPVGELMSTLNSPLLVTPTDVAVDSRGDVYVVDYDVNKVLKFSGTGALLTTWDIYPGYVVGPRYIAVDGHGNVYVTASYLVFKYTESGTVLKIWGLGDGLHEQAYGIAVGPSGHVYVADQGTNQVRVFTDGGNPIFSWGASGREAGQFANAFGVAVTANEQTFASDDSRVQKFGLGGSFLSLLGNADVSLSEFGEPSDVAVDSRGNLYVIDSVRYRVRKYADLTTPVVAPTWGRLKLLYR